MYRAYLPMKKSSQEWNVVSPTLCGRFHQAPIQVSGQQVWVNYSEAFVHISILALTSWPIGEPLHAFSTRKMRFLLDPKP